IPLGQVWVDANFKESQLRKIRLGQPVKLTADLYGKKIEFDGTVAGLGAGTGSAFALLPAQNATGNWIKVVQRVPVRVALDPRQVAASPLRVGLSMDAEVDVSKQDGKTLADAPRTTPFAETQVYSSLDKGAEAEVRRVIAANIGHGGPVGGVPAKSSVPAPAKLPAANVAASSAH
ncbi:MAG TPA: HlyD family secretion protein, partial [Ramlibacter sp.]|nr:HlyD family secretion protein [Ramlibacter sp.]